ncbi:MAG TPA: Na(+)/H(+) antiporter subunit B [Candidatus Krumholzibacterium sp.]|nr:Na(+)/H(+) antiporter subunit B [Candidatus Krumholzibacterium sp.]
MIKRLFILCLTAFFAWQFAQIAGGWKTASSPGETARHYLENGLEELGAANLVTAVVVTYRGLDTLGEVSVLFLAAAGVGLLLGGVKRRGEDDDTAGGDGKRRKSSEILTLGTDVLVPAIIIFGVYIFLGGHLSPGGGFQGGAVIASAFLLIFLTYPSYRLDHMLLKVTESFSGTGYVVMGLLGLLLAGGFLDSRLLPLGGFGRIISAGTIPVVYSLIGLKVGAELSGILDQMRGKA